MSKLCKTILNDYYKTNIFKVTILYIVFGVLIFTFSNKNLSYINMLYYIMGHPYLIAFFLIPIVIFSTIKVLNCLNKNMIIRFRTKQELIRSQFLLLISNTTTTFLLFIFITLLFANLFADRTNFILVDPYYSEINNLVGLIFCLIKLYLFLISINLLNVTCINILKGKWIVVIDIVILISFLGYVPEKFDILFPPHYLGYGYAFESFFQNFLLSALYLVSFFIISVFIFYKKLVNKNF